MKTIRWQVSWAVLLIVVLGSLATLSQTSTENVGMSVTRSISTAYAVPESVFRVTLVVKTNVDLYGVGIREVLPINWTIHPVENAGAAFKRSEAEWVFEQPLEAGTTHVLTYEVAIPSAGNLLSDPLPQCFAIQGTYQAAVPSFEIAILGESSLEVSSTLPVTTAIAHLIPAADGNPDVIDLRLYPTIFQSQLDRALELWRTDIAVPGTGGERIDLSTINHLVALYETCTPAHDLLSLSIDPRLNAVRTIETFLPCDSVLLPEGCFDPGQSARQVTVRVRITPSFDAYGVGLKEWFPPAWRVTPIEHDGFWYRPGAAEWVFPAKVHAGETIEVVYVVEVMPTVADTLETSLGCCGWDERLVGEASSALECSVAPVIGEDTVRIQSCVPVLLTISRWDVPENRFDAKLSNLITFPQVQRAVQFWQDSAPVPHTCGYTVGYHMLKQIVAYWRSGTPVTAPLPPDAPATCADSQELCAGGECVDGTLCRLLEAQDPDDFVGLPDSPSVSVDGGPDRVISCAQPTTTLTATVIGGVAPIRYEWIGPSGQPLGDTPSIVASLPGDYTVLVVSCGGCMAADTVTVLGDFAAPNIRASVSGVLTGYVPTVDLTATVAGGTPPFDLTWSGFSGVSLGQAPVLSVSEPGTYTVMAIGANGCSASASIAVAQDIEPPTVSIDITPVPVLTVAIDGADAVLTCAVPEVLLSGVVSGGREPYKLAWTDSAGAALGESLSLAVDAPDSYCLTVTGSNGCSTSAQVTVTEDIAMPAVSASVSGTLTCATTAVTLTATASEGRAPYEYLWTNLSGADIDDDDDETVSVTTPGTYRVLVRGSNGCQTQTEVTVTQDIAAPMVETTVDGVLTCAVKEVNANANISGGRLPFVIEWTNVAGQTVGNEALLKVSTPGIYTVRVTGSNGCSTSAQVTVTEDIATPAVSVQVDGVLTCAVTELNLTSAISGGRTPFRYSWVNAAGQLVGESATLVVSAPGTYTLTATGANGCASSASQVVEEDIAPPTVTVGADRTLTCSEPEVFVDALVCGGRVPFSFEWTDDCGVVIAMTEDVTLRFAGTYMLTVTGANGCSSSAPLVVVSRISPPIVDAGPDQILACIGDEVTLDATVSGGSCPYDYAWVDSCGEIVGECEDLVVSIPGSYILTVRSADGCIGVDSVVVDSP
ncbi:hypothetical protein ACFLSW_02295 [Candidatus Bipolaricaulota bacterium]